MIVAAHLSLGSLLRASQKNRVGPPVSDSSANRARTGTAIVFLALALSLGGVLQVHPASAQASLQTPSDSKNVTGTSSWKAHFDKQIAHGLEQHPSLRASYILTVIEVTIENEYLDLPRTTEALLEVIDRDINRDHRLMAIQALHQIGIEHAGQKQYRQAMNRLQALVDGEPSEQVRLAAMAALTRYTGTSGSRT